MLLKMASNSLHSRHSLAGGPWVAGTEYVYPIVFSSHLMKVGFKPRALHMLGKCPTTDPHLYILVFVRFACLFYVWIWISCLHVCLCTRRGHELP